MNSKFVFVILMLVVFELNTYLHGAKVSRFYCENVAIYPGGYSHQGLTGGPDSNGNEELVKEKWLSLFNHLINQHTGHGELYTECAHGPIERNWLEKG